MMRWLVGIAVVGCVAGSACRGANLAPDAADDTLGPIDDVLVDAPADPMLQGIETYLKASNTGAGDRLGTSLALAADGQTLAVGAASEDSQATGIDGDQLDNSKSDSGAVYVYVRSGGSWVQQAYLKASNSGASDQFGYTIGLSGDGNTLAVGALREESCATGVDGQQQDNACSGSGAAYVFVRENGTWSQQTYLKASNTRSSQGFSQALALSTDGNTLAVGEPGDPSATVGINGDPSDATKANSGSVFVFTRAGTTWSQQAYVKSSNPDQQDGFGSSVALSATGDVLAVGAVGESSAATGVNGSQLDNSLRESGAVYVFSRTNATWKQDAYIKASNSDDIDDFGFAVALSANGTILAASSINEASAATGINGDQTDNSQLHAGAVYAFAKTGTTWAQEAYIKEDVSKNTDELGFSLSLSANGNLLAAGAVAESGAPPPGIVPQSGAVYVFHRSGTTWAKQHYLKASNANNLDVFGIAVSLSGDGSALAIGASGEDGASTGLGGNPLNNSSMDSGAVYLMQ